MKITLLTIGKTDQPFVREGMELYEKRLKHYVKYERIELPDIKKVGGVDREVLKEKEGELILKHVRENDKLILLDERGAKYDSIEFANYIQQLTLSGGKSIIFVIGGAFGFSENVYKRSDGKISLSSMTFSHQIIRIIWSEQLYRAFTILNSEPYHHK